MYVITQDQTYYDFTIIKDIPNGVQSRICEFVYVGSIFIHYEDPIWDNPNGEIYFKINDKNYIRIYRYNNNMNSIYWARYINGVNSAAGSFTTPRAQIYVYKVSEDSWKYDPYHGSGIGGLLFFNHSGVPIDNPPTYYFQSNDTGYCSFTSQSDWDNFFNGNIHDGNYAGPDSGEAGGNGNFNNKSDPIDIPPDPIISVTDTSMISIFSPNIYELTQLANFLWTDNIFEAFSKIVADPMDAILSLSLTFAQPSLGEKYSMKIVNIPTGVEMSIVNSQYCYIDCGSLDINEYWGNALDYAPYTKISIYLPFIGSKELDTDQIMNSSVSVKYKVDLLTGVCVCFIQVTKNNLNSVLYNFSGNASASIPLTATSMNDLKGALFSSLIATEFGTTTAGAIAQTQATSALVVAASKKPYVYTGRLDGFSGALSIKKPYLIITRPVQSKPENYNTFVGYPSNITAQLSSLSGFTQIEYVHLENINATEAELTMIDELLKSGVIL